MEEEQAIKIRSDLYLKQQQKSLNDTPTKAEIIPINSEIETETDNHEICHLSLKTDETGKCLRTSPNPWNLSYSEKGTEMDTEDDDHSSPALDPGGNEDYKSDGSPPTSPTPPLKQALPADFLFPTRYNQPDNYDVLNLAKTTNWHKALIDLQAKYTSPEGLDLSVRRPPAEQTSSRTPSPTEVPKPFDSLKSLLQNQNESRHFIFNQHPVLKSFYSPLLNQMQPNQMFPWFLNSNFQHLVPNQPESQPRSCFPDEREVQPLDLSAKRDSYESLMEGSDINSRVKQIIQSSRGRKRADSQKRSYTEEKLNAALTAIFVGEVGTRKAATEFGIPRSTLRNKVQKIKLERERSKKALEQRERNSGSPITNGYGSTSQQIPNPAAESGASETLKTLLKIRLSEKLDEISKLNKTYLAKEEKQEFLGSVMSYLMDNLSSLSFNLENKETSQLPLSSLVLYPQIGDFIHKIVVEKFHEEILKTKVDEPKLDFPARYATEEYSSSHINVPVYPTNTFYQNSYDNKIAFKGLPTSIPPLPQECSADFKNVLNKIISNKMVYNSFPETGYSEPQASMIPLPVPEFTGSDDIEDKNLLAEINRSHAHHITKKSPKSPTNSGKGSRPKRGKYRNYDRNNLVKAVKAVQSGQMSVHRAGSHFGVPHSTLEYKVKERHLNRGKKKINTSATNSFLKVENCTSFPSEKTELENPENFRNNNSEYSNNDVVSIIKYEENPCKKFKSDNDIMSSSSSPLSSHGYPFWNPTHTVNNPFLANPFTRESLYPSGIMPGSLEIPRNFGAFAKDTLRVESTTADGKIYSEDSQNIDNHARQQRDTTALQNGIFNSLLLKNIQNSMTSDGSINRKTDLQKGDNTPTEQISQHSLLLFNSLFPSILAARSSLAAALSNSLHDNGSTEARLGSPPLLIKDPSGVPIPVDTSLRDNV